MREKKEKSDSIRSEPSEKARPVERQERPEEIASAVRKISREPDTKESPERKEKGPTKPGPDGERERKPAEVPGPDEEKPEDKPIRRGSKPEEKIANVRKGSVKTTDKKEKTKIPSEVARVENGAEPEETRAKASKNEKKSIAEVKKPVPEEKKACDSREDGSVSGPNTSPAIKESDNEKAEKETGKTVESKKPSTAIQKEEPPILGNEKDSVDQAKVREKNLLVGCCDRLNSRSF